MTVELLRSLKGHPLGCTGQGERAAYCLQQVGLQGPWPSEGPQATTQAEDQGKSHPAKLKSVTI